MRKRAVDLSADEIQLILSTLKRFLSPKNTQAYLFGSRLTGRSRPESDLDLMIRQDQELPLHQLALLKEAFEESLLPFKVDVLDYHQISEKLRRRILDSGHLLSWD